MGYTNIKRMDSSPITGPNKTNAGPPLKKMGTFPGNKQEKGGTWPGYRDWPASNQNRKGGNWP